MCLAFSFLAREILGCPMLDSGLSAETSFPFFSPLLLYATLIPLRAEVKKSRCNCGGDYESNSEKGLLATEPTWNVLKLTE
jgi:hypothetical protein